MRFVAGILEQVPPIDPLEIPPMSLVTAVTATEARRRGALHAAGRQGGRGRRLACAGLAFGAAFMMAAAAHAQQIGNGQASNGQIYIPGPGERGAGSQAGVARAAGTVENSAADGMIRIPGPGERTATGSGAMANGMISIPGPGERTAAASVAAQVKVGAARGAGPASGLNAGPVAGPGWPSPGAPVGAGIAPSAGMASNSVMPVVVTPARRMARGVQPIIVDRPASAAPDARTNATANWPAATARNAEKAAASAANVANLTAAASASAAPAGQQDGESIRRAALSFLQQQSAGLPGKITITVAPAFPRGLAACTTLMPFMPPGARLWGRTSVGVRCTGARPWTLYLQARVALVATYYLAAHQIEPGAVLGVGDLATREGDLANLPRTIVTDPSQVVGAVALARITAGVPLRQDMLRSASSVTIGQTVRVVAVGQGFSISAEGNVMNNAAPGQQVRVKTPGGQIISGIVKDNSTVEIQM